MTKVRIYTGLILGIIGNAILIGMALPYLKLPLHSVVYADRNYLNTFFIVMPTCLLLGIPLTFWDAFRYRKLKWNAFLVVVSICVCIGTLFLPDKLQRVIGDARQLETPCDVCDGGDNTLKGLYLVY
jgi:hypothetical protein